jgi:hypothetical protein
MKRIWIAAGVFGAMALGATGMAFGQSSWTAKQEGFRQWGTALGSTLKIKVEAGLPGAGDLLLPDNGVCPGAGNCAGGALSFSITNPTDVPLSVTDVAVQTRCFGYPCVPAPVLGSSVYECMSHMQFVAPRPAGQTPLPSEPLSLSSWPILAPHSTLQVNGSDYGGLGNHMLHLDYTTPDSCQGASFVVGLVVTAKDAA